MAKEIWELEEREPTEQELLFAETHKRSIEIVRRIEDMMLTVVKTQVIVENFMNELLEAYGKDPQRLFFTGPKITECKERLKPPEVGDQIWSLFSLCTHVRNELVHSLNTEKIKEKSELVRQQYAAITPEGPRQQEILNSNDTDVVANALRHCGGYIVIATDAKVAANKANGT
ncbi:hypothetical protein ABIE89_002133 [Bradyrhizobium niftali]|uniref:hypothetical protein n=1 Tax=Bradyrhizobium niftali TaxID=2560055 RepID=UPI00383314BF